MCVGIYSCSRMIYVLSILLFPGLMHQVIVVGGNDEDMTALLDVLNCPPLLPRPSSSSASSTTPLTAAPPYPQVAERNDSGQTAVMSAPGAGDGCEPAPQSVVERRGLPLHVATEVHDTSELDTAEVVHILNLRIDILKVCFQKWCIVFFEMARCWWLQNTDEVSTAIMK